MSFKGDDYEILLYFNFYLKNKNKINVVKHYIVARVNFIYNFY